MPVTLRVTSGPSTGRKAHVARGQIAKIGRTEWADISFPNESGMADVHFVIHEDGPTTLIKDSSGGIGTRVNGTVISETRLHTGDVVTAGETDFSVVVEGETTPISLPIAGTDATAQNIPQTSEGPSAVRTAVDYCRPLTLSDRAKELLAEGMAPAEYLDLLAQNELFPDALRFLAFWLPRPTAVAWGCDCIEQVLAGKLTPLDQKAQDAAKTWSKEPNEKHCRAAEQAAIETDYSGAPGWLALGAFWSGDSLAPADLPPVPPGEALAVEAITAALTMAATNGDSRLVTDRYRTFLNTGRSMFPDAGSP
jgi:hypothetical protein